MSGFPFPAARYKIVLPLHGRIDTAAYRTPLRSVDLS